MRNFLRYNTKRLIILVGLVILFSFVLVSPSEAAVPSCSYSSRCADYYSQYPYLTTMCPQDWCVGSCQWNCCCVSEDIIEPSAPYCCSAYNSTYGWSRPPTNCTCDEFYSQSLCCWPSYPVLCGGGCYPAGTQCTGCNGSLCANYQEDCFSKVCCPPYSCRTDYDGSGKFCCSSSECGHNNTCYANGAVSGDYKCSSGTWGLNIAPPSVTTEVADIDLQNNKATLNGNVTATVGSNVDKIMFVWGTSPGSYPNNSGEITYTGAFEYTLTAMTPGTIYYYKAQAHNSLGWSDLANTNERRVVIYTADGDQQQFTTLPLIYTLTITKTGTNPNAGTVTSSPSGINCGSTCSFSYNYGTVVTLSATVASGSYFAGWSGADCSGTGNCTLTMDAAKSVTATFHYIAYTLTVTKDGTGSGTVTSNPAGISCGSTCSASYNSGTSVTLTATPASGSAFAGWSGGGCSGTGTCTLTTSAAQSVTATFNLIPYTLTVTKAGTGSGTVTSNPAGISCGSTCSASYDSGTSVTLTATPASGSYFAGWSGAGCSGMDNCNITMDAAKSVTATFYIPTCSAGGFCETVGNKCCFGGQLYECKTITCSNDLECDDGSPCTSDNCINAGTPASSCVYTPIAGENGLTACKRCDGSSLTPVNITTFFDSEGSNICAGTCASYCSNGSCVNTDTGAGTCTMGTNVRVASGGDGHCASGICVADCTANGGACSSDAACCSVICGTDADGDRYWTSASHTGTCQAETALGYTDCNDGDVTRWRNRYTDSDGDTYCPDSFQTCVGDHSGYRDSCATYTDCNDGDAARWRNRYVDGDDDTYGAGLLVCVGDHAGYVDNNDDCYDANADAHPGQTTYYDTDRGDGSFDYDCNGQENKNPTRDCLTTHSLGCYTTMPTTRWGYVGAVPACGADGTARGCSIYVPITNTTCSGWGSGNFYSTCGAQGTCYDWGNTGSWKIYDSTTDMIERPWTMSCR